MQNPSISLKQFIKNDSDLNTISSNLFEDLIEEVLIGIYFEVHRAAKFTRSLFVDESPTDENNKYGMSCIVAVNEEHVLRYVIDYHWLAIIDKKGLDIFGQVPVKKQHECVCPNCSRNLAASRFAPHLEKCMGMGRNSSRIASKRIANTSMKNNESDGDEYDNNDTDWSVSYCGDSKKTRKKRLKNSNGNSVVNGNNGTKKVNNSKNKSGPNAK